MSGSPDVIRTSIHTNVGCTSERGRNPSAVMLPGNGLIDSQQTFASAGSDVHRSSNHRVNRSSNHTRGARLSSTKTLYPLFNGALQPLDLPVSAAGLLRNTSLQTAGLRALTAARLRSTFWTSP